MRGLLSRLLLDQTASWGAVIIVGAGSCSEWPQLSRLAALRFVLVEPQPRLFDELAGQTRSAPRVECVRAAWVPAGDQATLQVLTNARESGMSAPTGLVDFYPNLKQLQTASVAARPIAAALAEQALDPQARNLLWLDTPGQAGALLAAIPLELLHRFETILVRAGRVSLYEGDQPVGELLNQLHALGFDALAEDVDCLPPHAAWQLRRSEERVRRIGLERAMQDAHAARQALQDHADTLQAEVASLRAARDEAQAERGALEVRNSGLAARCEALEEQKAHLARGRAAQDKERADLNARLNLLGRQRAEALEARHALATQKAALEGRCDALSSDVSAATALAGARARENAELAARLSVLAREMEALAAQRDQLARERSTLQVAHDDLAISLAAAVAARDSLSRETAAASLRHEEQAQELRREKVALAEARSELRRLALENQQLVRRQQARQQEFLLAQEQVRLIKAMLHREEAA